MRALLGKLYTDYRLKKLKRQGLQIGDNVQFWGLPSFGTEPYLISIGNNILMSGRIMFVTHDGGTYAFRYQEKYKTVRKYGRITIKDQCFIGYGTIIMPNVTIGPNSVIAAGSVVTKDVPPRTVYAGVPAKQIMTLEEYAEKCKAQNVDWDEERYKTDKIGEILRHYPRPW